MGHVGILGGSFNPIHLGHLRIGHLAARTFGLDRVLLVPCSVSPFKVGVSGQASGADRLEMARLAAADDPLFEVCGLEIERGGVSYAIDTVRALRAAHPDDRFSFIIGTDALRDLKRWHSVDALLTLCALITVERPETDGAATVRALDFDASVRQRLAAGLVRGEPCEISASDIRRRIAEGRSIRYLVCPAVEAYIRSRGLYGATKED